jgi:hypothetical protein
MAEVRARSVRCRPQKRAWQAAPRIVAARLKACKKCVLLARDPPTVKPSEAGSNRDCSSPAAHGIPCREARHRALAAAYNRHEAREQLQPGLRARARPPAKESATAWQSNAAWFSLTKSPTKRYVHNIGKNGWKQAKATARLRPGQAVEGGCLHRGRPHGRRRPACIATYPLPRRPSSWPCKPQVCEKRYRLRENQR